MLRCLLMGFLMLSTTGCAALYSGTVEETNRPDGTYGDWVTKESVDDFGSYSFSTASGSSSSKDVGQKIQIVVQDDFIIKLYVGDGYICSDGGIPADTIWSRGNEVFREQTLMFLPYRGARNYFSWEGRTPTLKRLMHLLNFYDSLLIRYTDICGKQRTLKYAISGSHHNLTDHKDFK